MRHSRFYISLYIIIPFIITGLTILAAILSFRLTKYGLSHGSDPAQVVFWFIFAISIIAFATGFFSVLLSGIMVGLSLYLTGEAFLPAAKLVVAAHLPVMFIEGILTTTCALFLKKVRPEILEGNHVS